MGMDTTPVTGDRVDFVVTRIIAEQMGRGITVADVISYVNRKLHAIAVPRHGDPA